MDPHITTMQMRVRANLRFAWKPYNNAHYYNSEKSKNARPTNAEPLSHKEFAAVPWTVWKHTEPLYKQARKHFKRHTNGLKTPSADSQACGACPREDLLSS